MPLRYALVIGISRYGKPWRPLKNAWKDAEQIAQYLERYGGYEVTRLPVKYISGNNCPGFYKVVDEALTNRDLSLGIKNFLENKDLGSEILIYFAGHGFALADEFEEKQGYLAASNSQKSGQNAIALDSLNRQIAKRLQKSRTGVIIFLDCCHAGYSIENPIERQTFNQGFAPFLKYANFGFLAACRRYEKSYESDVTEHGLFTEAILKAFEVYRNNNLLTFSGLAQEVAVALRGSGQEPIDLALQGSRLEIINSLGKAESSTDRSFLTSNFIDLLRKLNYKKPDRIFREFIEDADRRVGAFWIRGKRDSAQKWLLYRLWRDLVPGSERALKKALKIRASSSIEEIWHQLGSWLGTSSKPPEIAEAILDYWRNQKTTALIFYEIERLPDDDLQALVDRLWKPLVQQTQSIESNMPLLLFMVDMGRKGDRSCPIAHSNVYDADCPEQVVELVAEGFKTRDFRWVTDHSDALEPYLRGLSPEELRDKLVQCNDRAEMPPLDVLSELCDYCGMTWENDVASHFLAG